MSYQKGDRVRIVVGPLGLVTHVTATRFEDATVGEDDIAIYDGPHPKAETDTDYQGWHVLKVGELFCPVHEFMIEPAS
jgi:hypothetical protein